MHQAETLLRLLIETYPRPNIFHWKMLFNNKNLAIQKSAKDYGYYCHSDINIRNTNVLYMLYTCRFAPENFCFVKGG